MSIFLNNPAAQTLLLGAIGAIAFWARELPGLVFGWLKRFFMSSLTVDSRDEFLFGALVQYMQSYPGLRGTNQITAHSKRKGSGEFQNLDDELRGGFVPDAYFSPAPGLHIFRAQGRWLWMHRNLHIQQSVIEQVTLSHFGRRPEFLQQFLNDAIADRVERESAAQAVYVPNPFSGGEWMRARLGSPRPLGSVILRAGQKEALVNDMQGFFAGRERYSALGIPWRRGYLLYGPPGTGKTSLVSALASHLKLNICTFSLASPLVTDEKIHTLLACVPQRSLLLIEDVDAFFDQRDAVHDEVKLSFSGFLNALDGVATQEGSVLFMTTNHPEKLDPALVRAGRVDVKIKLDICDPDQMRSLFLKFHPDAAAADAFMADYGREKLTPAEVQAIMMRRYVTPTDPALDAEFPAK